MASRSITLALLTLCPAVGCGCGGAAPKDEHPPNVLFIAIDTLRVDHVGCYGAERDATPSVDALAADAVRFERAYATAPWTIPSVGSMVTGLYPSRHTATSFPRALPDDVTTLAEILKSEGYATAGVVSHWAIGRKHNFQQGYDVYLDSEGKGHDHVSTPGVTRQALEQLETLAAGDAPFLLFVHYFDPHYNYLHHSEYGFASPSAGRLKGGEPIGTLTQMTGDLTPQETQFLRDLYDEEIRFTDDGVGRLLERLRALGLEDDTLIVFTADHGEEFLDHGRLGHTKTLYEELVRVPLIVRLPGRPDRAGAVQPRPVSLVSLTPTVLDLLGVDAARFPFQAGSIAPLVEGATEGGPETAFFEVDFVPVKTQRVEVHKKGLAGARFKLVRDDTNGEVELYDLDADPLETSNLRDLRPELTAELVAALDRSIALARSEPLDIRERTLTEDEIRTLKSLGYLGD